MSCRSRAKVEPGRSDGVSGRCWESILKNKTSLPQNGATAAQHHQDKVGIQEGREKKQNNEKKKLKRG